ncbi:DUF4351 domain-containing protein [Chamaesiphon sp. GL140_3_metabinner_50]|uniref:DUF4351 domain-containing protein n=1 Tax=Chamaesiphon sp. GL140_3_metabinner_50 TaxID=2970812 RepID=UPI0025E967A3|nr:DUF4351 domain-containing protein [Chamaesiphon sp. GL140_3_metabinner_50]
MSTQTRVPEQLLYPMTAQPHQPHDKFVKAIFPLLFPTQIAATQRPVRLKEELFIDIFYKSLTDPNPLNPQQEQLLGMLGRMMKIHPTIIVEHYSQYLKPEYIDSCTLRKQVYWYSENDTRIDRSSDLRLDKSTANKPTPLSPDMPFTWILTAKCGDNLLLRTRAEPDPIFGKHVYRLDPQTGIGIVVLEKLAYSEDTMLLKLLSNNPDTVLRAYRDIDRLYPDLPLANDIIGACNEYCIHIQGLTTTASIDPQEVSTMSILQQEPAYQKRVKELQAEGEARGKAEGKLETAKKLLSARFGKVSPEIEAKLTSMTADDLDDLLIRSLDWSTSNSLFEYLGIPTSPN